MTGKNRLCGFVNKATKGSFIKVHSDNFSCTSGPNLTGMIPPTEQQISGQILYHCGLYNDLSISREVSESFKRIPQSIHGLEIGPIEDMNNAEIIIIIAFAEQIMRIIEGYSYHYGVPKPYVTIGNAAMCSDMTSKPFMKNDINLSLMCCGARTSTRSNFGELGIGMPSHMFKHIAESILEINN